MASSNVKYKAKDGTLINLTTKVINNTTSTSTTDALSAAQGKVLNDEKAASKVLAVDTDLNTVKTPGMYSCGGGNSIKNKPTGLDAIGLIVVHNASGEYYTQILTTSTNTSTYRRNCTNGTWSGWTIDKYSDTDSWRGIQNNLTSDSATDSLSAAQGKKLKSLIDSLPYAASSSVGGPAKAATKLQTYKKGSTTETYGDNYPLYAQWTDGSTVSLKCDDYKTKVDKASTADSAASATNATSASKVANAITIQTNGTTAATFDGSSAKTVNITKASIGLGSVDNTADANKSVKYATSAGTSGSASKLSTARTVSGGIDIPISFKFDGSADVSVSSGFYSANCASGNKSNYPFHRIAYTPVITNAYSDYSVMLYLTQGFSGGSFGLVRVTVRTNNTPTVSSVEVKWLIRSGYFTDSVQVGLYNVFGKTYADVFLKIGSYGGTTIRAFSSDGRGTISRTFTLVNSSEANDTTETDAKTSKECWKDIATAATKLHNQAYSVIVAGSDSGVVATANTANSVAWGSVTGKPTTFTPATHKHAKSDITDFPASLKNPTALTVQGNGTTIATYDGSAAKTVNITKASVGLGSVNNTADADKSVKYATSAGSANAVAWDKVSGKPSSYPPASHEHDLSTMINKLSTVTSDPTDADYYVCQYAGGGTSTTSYHRRPVSALWNYIKSKASGIYAAKSHTHTKSEVGLGNVDNTADSAKSVKYATSAGSANAVAWDKVSGNHSTYAPAAHKHAKADITDFPASLKNPTALTIQTNGTTAATYDGSAAKTVNVTKASIGLGSVDNTADSAKSVKYATSAGSASSATTASKLGSATVGSASTPIYLNGGVATACTDVQKTPIYSTTDLTPGVSKLADGQLYIVYYN